MDIPRPETRPRHNHKQLERLHGMTPSRLINNNYVPRPCRHCRMYFIPGEGGDPPKEWCSGECRFSAFPWA